MVREAAVSEVLESCNHGCETRKKKKWTPAAFQSLTQTLFPPYLPSVYEVTQVATHRSGLKLISPRMLQIKKEKYPRRWPRFPFPGFQVHFRVGISRSATSTFFCHIPVLYTLFLTAAKPPGLRKVGVVLLLRGGICVTLWIYDSFVEIFLTLSKILSMPQVFEHKVCSCFCGIWSKLYTVNWTPTPRLPLFIGQSASPDYFPHAKNACSTCANVWKVYKQGITIYSISSFLYTKEKTTPTKMNAFAAAAALLLLAASAARKWKKKLW